MCYQDWCYYALSFPIYRQTSAFSSLPLTTFPRSFSKSRQVCSIITGFHSLTPLRSNFVHFLRFPSHMHPWKPPLIICKIACRGLGSGCSVWRLSLSVRLRRWRFRCVGKWVKVLPSLHSFEKSMESTPFPPTWDTYAQLIESNSTSD